MKHRNKGFTLIELLIVMVIIGVLATLGLVAYTQSLQNARNARRVASLNSIQAAFEQYYTANGTYAGCTTMDTELQGGVIPDDPSGGNFATESCGAASYCFCAAMEPASTSVRGGNSSGNNCSSWTNNGRGTHYCVTNRQ